MADSVALFQASTEVVRQSSVLANEFVKGDKTVDVVGSAGTYPSLAKIADTAQKALNDITTNTQTGAASVISNGQTAIDTIVAECRLALDNNTSTLKLSQDAIAAVLHLAQGVIGKTFPFASTTTLVVNHNMGCMNFTKSIRDNAGNDIFAPVSNVTLNSFQVDFASPVDGTLNVMFYLNC